MRDAITGPGRYVTSGGEAVVLEVLNGIAFGRAQCHGWWTACQWRVDTGEETWNEPVKARTDIVGPYVEPRRRQVEGWVNVYNQPNFAAQPYPSRQYAIENSGPNRVDTVYVRETEPPK